MPKLVAMIQTTWPHIRVGLYEHDNALFQFVEEGLQTSGTGTQTWSHFHQSGLYADANAAQADMVEYYAWQVEDEYAPLDPQTVVVLGPPDTDVGLSGFDRDRSLDEEITLTFKR